MVAAECIIKLDVILLVAITKNTNTTTITSNIRNTSLLAERNWSSTADWRCSNWSNCWERERSSTIVLIVVIEIVVVMLTLIIVIIIILIILITTTMTVVIVVVQVIAIQYDIKIYLTIIE